MRVQTIEIADFVVTSTVIRDSERAFQWVVRVTERSGERHMVFERRGRCGPVSRGDALEIAAQAARGIASGLARPADGGWATQAAAG
ncbi:hypothetical protein [Paraburkholderia sp.]|jgi:hypothetical protein|uniref:hypothetical protein n=1 Tax=Paraburkholderia sp. TaxID=1926495 RepID=UPI002F3E3BF2